MQRLGLELYADANAAGGCYASEVQSYCFFAEYANFLSMYFCSGFLHGCDGRLRHCRAQKRWHIAEDMPPLCTAVCRVWFF